ncbi:hypothetical protein AX17_003656 [Amanita inopinata Kibby_2008]|nr:hypothetical protein AX17_003656 [Amanita inopinata Kibby_2008]
MPLAFAFVISIVLQLWLGDTKVRAQQMLTDLMPSSMLLPIPLPSPTLSRTSAAGEMKGFITPTTMEIILAAEASTTKTSFASSTAASTLLNTASVSHIPIVTPTPVPIPTLTRPLKQPTQTTRQKLCTTSCSSSSSSMVTPAAIPDTSPAAVMTSAVLTSLPLPMRSEYHRRVGVVMGAMVGGIVVLTSVLVLAVISHRRSIERSRTMGVRRTGRRRYASDEGGDDDDNADDDERKGGERSRVRAARDGIARSDGHSPRHHRHHSHYQGRIAKWQRQTDERTRNTIRQHHDHDRQHASPPGMTREHRTGVGSPNDGHHASMDLARSTPQTTRNTNPSSLPVSQFDHGLSTLSRQTSRPVSVSATRADANLIITNDMLQTNASPSSTFSNNLISPASNESRAPSIAELQRQIVALRRSNDELRKQAQAQSQSQARGQSQAQDQAPTQLQAQTQHKRAVESVLVVGVPGAGTALGEGGVMSVPLLRDAPPAYERYSDGHGRKGV